MSSNNIISNCLVAWAVTSGPGPDPVGSLRRVERHYQACFAERLSVSSEVQPSLGAALIGRSDDRLRWPLWVSEGELACATLSVPAGWSRIVGDMEHAEAARHLAGAILEDPDLVARLDPPVVLAAIRKRESQLALVNDAVGVGRLYEMKAEWGYVWSNRLGALPIFAGLSAANDLASWQVFAASGWFLGDQTPLSGCKKVPPGSRIVARSSPEGAKVSHSSDDLRGPLVEPRRGRFDRGGKLLGSSADEAAVGTRQLAEELGAAWRVPLAVSLTGGRDSRVSAAAALAGGIDVTFNTGDQVPGEVDAVRHLISRAPVTMDHTVNTPGQGPDPELPPLESRVADIHLVHDGMRNPQEIRRQVDIPHGPSPPPTLSGHGGELGHGFYYGHKNKLKRLERGGDGALLAQLERNARRKHSAATAESYERYMEECERTLDAGRHHGLAGPPLLDWFYLAQRLPYRSGLGARTARWSACVNPSFIRGAFDLRPRERLTARFHRMVIARLVPGWEDVPFFSEADDGDAMPDINRQRLWEKDGDAEAVDEILNEGGSWTEIFDRDRVLAMWKEVRGGAGSSEFEHIFDRVVWRATFDRHVAQLSESARA